MSSRQRMFGGFLFGLLTVMAVLVVYPAGGQPPPKNEAPRTLNEILQAGRQAAIDSDRAGRALLEQLGNAKLTDKERGACAHALGKLHYLPAIPKLLELIKDFPEGVEDPSKQSGMVALPPSVEYPCMSALADYGELALPAVTDAYLKTDDEKQRVNIAILLEDIRHGKRNKIYLQGLLLETQDHRSTMRLLHLIEDLQRDDRYLEGSRP
jgi:hypothetical protein